MTQVQFDYLTHVLQVPKDISSSSSSASKELASLDILTLQYCSFINSQHHFVRLFQEEVMDYILDSLPNVTESDEKQLILLEEKWRHIVQLHTQCMMEAMEALIKHTQEDIKSHMTDTMFTNKKLAWNKEVMWINPVKRCVKLKLYILNACLDPSIQGAQVSNEENNNTGDGDAYWTTQDLKLRFVASISKMLIQHYIELLLQSNISTTVFAIAHYSISAFAVNNPSNAHSNLMNRVNEDIQLVIAMIEEMRLIVIHYHMNDMTHYIQSNSVNKRAGGKKNTLFRRNGGGATTTSSSTGETSTSSKSNNTTNTITTYQNYQNKQTFDELVFPISHLSILLSMLFSFSEVSYSVHFVKKELLESFGVYAVHLWQLLCIWRGDKKELIISEYQVHFKDWYQAQIVAKADRIQQHARMDISFLLKNKYANIAKL